MNKNRKLDEKNVLHELTALYDIVGEFMNQYPYTEYEMKNSLSNGEGAHIHTINGMTYYRFTV